MFCSKCGKQVLDGAVFCPACGNQFNRVNSVWENTSAPAPQPASRKETVDEMCEAFNYFSQKSQSYNEYDDLRAVIRRKMKPHIALMIFGIIFLVLGIIGIFLALPLISFVIEFRMTGIDENTQPLLLIAGSILLGILFMIINGIINSVRKGSLKAAVDQAQAIATELSVHYNKYGPCDIRKEFTNPKIIKAMTELIDSGRANTPTEAIDTMLFDLHKTQMQLQAELQPYTRSPVMPASISGGANAATNVFCSARFFGI